jgi:uncharacterized surface anchored protein
MNKIGVACLGVLMLTATFAMGQPEAARVQQSSYGRIVGTVKDESNANVAGAEVSLIHSQHAVLRAILTDDSGKFAMDQITPGSYELKVTRPGFSG